MKNELDLEIISKSFSNISKAAEIPVKVLSPAVHEYQKEFEMQPVMDGPLPKFCKAHHCTESYQDNGVSMTIHHFCCSECGASFDLSTKYGKKAAKYGLCKKCGVEFVIRTYKKFNFLAKVFFFIPYLLIKMAYKKEFKNNVQHIT